MKVFDVYPVDMNWKNWEQYQVQQKLCSTDDDVWWRGLMKFRDWIACYIIKFYQISNYLDEDKFFIQLL